MIVRQYYLDKIIPLIDKKLIKVLTGVRRSGKTVLLSQIQDHLLKTGVPNSNIVSISLESMRNKKSLENEEKVLEIKNKLFNNAKDEMDRALEEYNKEHGSDLSYPSEDKVKTDKNNSEAFDDKADKNEKKENLFKKDEVIDNKAASVDEKEISVKIENKNIPDESIPKPQNDVKKEDPFRNKIDIPDDEDAILPFGDAPDIKVAAPPKKGIIKKFFSKK